MIKPKVGEQYGYKFCSNKIRTITVTYVDSHPHAHRGFYWIRGRIENSEGLSGETFTGDSFGLINLTQALLEKL